MGPDFKVKASGEVSAGLGGLQRGRRSAGSGFNASGYKVMINLLDRRGPGPGKNGDLFLALGHAHTCSCILGGHTLILGGHTLSYCHTVIHCFFGKVAGLLGPLRLHDLGGRR